MVEGSSFIYINTFQTFTDANTVFAPISTLTVMEVGLILNTFSYKYLKRIV